MIHQQTLEFRTRGRGTQEVTAEVQRAVAASGALHGECPTDHFLFFPSD